MVALPTIAGALRGVLPPGTQLSGIYEIDALLATGGMGEVYRAHTIETGDTVAIKMIRWEFASDDTFVALFRKEAASLYKIQHEAIIRYYISATDPVLRRPYLAMELIEGESLTEALKRTRLDVPSVLILMERLASGLAVAHDFGIIHRDIAPDNVYLPNGDPSRAKIIDFGIARSAFGGDSVIGASFAGKLNFVSPEQVGLFEGEVSARSDIYSLGLTLAAAAAGSPIDMGGTHVSMVQKRQVVPDLASVDARLRPVLAPLLQPRPKDRPGSMREVVALARTAAAEVGREAPKPPPRAQTAAALRAAKPAPKERPLGRIAGVVAAGMLLLGLGVVAFEQWGRGDLTGTASLPETRVPPVAKEAPSGATSPPPSLTGSPAPPVPAVSENPERPPPGLTAPPAAVGASPALDAATRDNRTPPPPPVATTTPVPSPVVSPAPAPAASSLPLPPPSEAVVDTAPAQPVVGHEQADPAIKAPPMPLEVSSAPASVTKPPAPIDQGAAKPAGPAPEPPAAASSSRPNVALASPAPEPLAPAEPAENLPRLTSPSAPDSAPSVADVATRDDLEKRAPPSTLETPPSAADVLAATPPPPPVVAPVIPQPPLSSAIVAAPSAPQPAKAPSDTVAAAPVAATLQPGEFADCPTCPPMVVIGQGSFRMGSTADATERPIHKVTVGGFAIGVAPVTVAEWGHCVAEKACHIDPGGEPGTFVHNLSFDDATDYVTWLSRITGHPYRLPSEAEWEYAARAGTTTRYWWGEQFQPDLSPCRTCGPLSRVPPDVHRFRPNPFGLLAVTGAVSQWTLDCWHKNYSRAPADGSAWSSPGCHEHVLRGGAWDSAADALRITNRDFYDGGVRYPGHGLRVARSL